MIRVALHRVRATATSVSGSASATIPAGGRNRATPLGNGRVARRVHPLVLAVLSSVSACVIPPPLTLDEPDAGPNHPPVIRVVRDGAGQALDRPGPLTFVVGTGELLITAADTDLGDTLYARLYIDYGLPAPDNFSVACEAAPGAMPEIERTITCPLLGLCTDDMIGDPEHVFEIDVLDRLPRSTAERLFRDVTEPGEIATFWWKLNCVGPS